MSAVLRGTGGAGLCKTVHQGLNQKKNGSPGATTSERGIDRRLCDLHGLNRAFLALLIAERSGYSSIPYGLPETVIHSLARLSEDRLDALARCPYALFDLGLDTLGLDALPWDTPMHARPSSAQLLSTNTRGEFARAALYFAWHAALTDLAFARFAFGLTAYTAHQLTALSVTDIAGVVATATQRLAARWPQHPNFWPDIIRNITRDETTLRAAQWTGCQLLAHTFLRASHSRTALHSL